MMSSDDSTLDELLFSSFHGHREGVTEAQGLSSSSGDEVSTPSPSLLAGPVVCGGCGEQVNDRFVLVAAGQSWHGSCLRCSQCQCELQTQSSLYCREGKIYCQLDYCRLFGVGQCARCSQPIPSSALVMRSGDLTFHPQCFSCQECDVTLLPGSLYCVEGRNLYCQSHYSCDLQIYNSNGEGEELGSSPEPRLDERAQGGGAQRRTKRMRTCFRREQLRALEAYFAQKHNPDGKDWISLSSHTGLPKRVLQVWFQNARAKLRRSLSTDSTTHPEPMATVAMASSEDAINYQTSTIDQLELSLLTAPISESPTNHSVSHSFNHSDPVESYKNSAFLDYNTHNPLLLSSFGNIDLDPGVIME